MNLGYCCLTETKKVPLLVRIVEQTVLPEQEVKSTSSKELWITLTINDACFATKSNILHLSLKMGNKLRLVEGSETSTTYTGCTINDA